ncbi:galactosyltransferase-related protein [Neobacillus vireti]|uniref:galactosyltransferase-related protein n=1 Tax=Neobacillus vireti TaxID=220686 RepID=UPI002FFDF33C
MLEKVSIVIPFQTDNGPRAEVFEWIKHYYEQVMPEAELCLGIIDKGEINKAKAVNLAAKKATREILVIADADVVFDPQLIIKALKVLPHAPCIIPFTEIYDIDRSGTERLVKSKPAWPFAFKADECKKASWIYQGFAGKLIIIPKVNFEAAGGFDERFIGWGGEDDAFSLAVQTISGKLENIEGVIFHLWHPSSSYSTNPFGKANGELLNRYKRANGDPQKMLKLIRERKYNQDRIHQDNIELLNSKKGHLFKSPKSQICFAILVHEKKNLVKQLIENVRYFCPNSAIVLYNGSYDSTLCEGLGVPVCPSSHKLNYGYTAVYFLETMEWLEEMEIQYNYFINIDSDALFIKSGYEEFIQNQMKDTDYMGVDHRVTANDWHIGKEVWKDQDRWKKLFNMKPLDGVFNVGQVISRPLVKALLEPERKERLKRALLKTYSWGMDEVVFVNLAKELGFSRKKYPNPYDSVMIRYRPHFTLEEIIYHLSYDNGYLCHPISREENHSIRHLIHHLQTGIHSELYQNREYPWHEDNQNQYSISLPVKGETDLLELVVRSGSSLTHYRQGEDFKWYKTQTFAEGVLGMPFLFRTQSGDLGVVCKLQNGEVGLWKRYGDVWYGPFIFQIEKNDLIMGSHFTADLLE